MPTLSLNDIVLVTAVSTCLGQRVMNTFPFRVKTITGTPADGAAFAAMYTAMNAGGGLLAKLRACQPPELLMTRCWLQVISPTRFRKLEFFPAVNGTFNDVCETANLQGSITRTGDLAIRAGVGGIRVMIGTGADSLQNGLLSEDLKGAFDTLALEMLDEITTVTPAVTYEPLVGMSKGTGVFIKCTNTAVQEEVRTLRRRTVGRGI